MRIKLPYNHPHTAVQSLAGSSYSEYIPNEITKLVRGFAKSEGVTMFVVMMAVLQKLLHIYSSQTDIIVGTPVMNRRLEQAEGIIGLFANVLAIRTDFSKPMNFRTLLHNVETTLLEGLNHQSIPIHMILKKLCPQRNLNHYPVIQVVFTYQIEAFEKLDLNRVSSEFLDIELVNSGVSSNEITIFIKEVRDSLKMEIEYCSDLFEVETIKKLVSDFVLLLINSVEKADLILSEVDLLNGYQNSVAATIE